MQTVEWKGTLPKASLMDTIFANISTLTPRCGRCHRPLDAKPVEVIADIGDWHVGWQRYCCHHCTYQADRLVVTRGTQHLEYKTHVMC